MKTCPTCARNYPDEYGYCLDHGVRLVPLGGQKTDLIKGPYIHGGTTDQIPAAADSEETEILPTPPYVPGPTEPSPLPTIPDRPTPRPVEVSPKSPQSSNSASTTRFAVGAIVVLSVIAAVVFLSQYQPGISITNSQGANTGSSPQTRGVSPANTVTSVPNSQTGGTQPAGNQAVAEVPATQPAGPVDAPAVTDAETNRQVIISQSKRIQVKKWNASEGVVFNPCPRPVLADVVRWNPIGPEGSTEEVSSAGPYYWVTPARVVTLESSDDSGFEKGQRMAVLDEILHIGLTANLGPSDASRVSNGMKVVFTDRTSRNKFDGFVDSVDATTGKVHIRLDDKQVFHMQRPAQCLDLAPGRSGTVHFNL